MDKNWAGETTANPDTGRECSSDLYRWQEWCSYVALTLLSNVRMHKTAEANGEQDRPFIALLST